MDILPPLSASAAEADRPISFTTAEPEARLLEVPGFAFGEPDTGNRVIQGDNRLALQALLPEYHGRIRCIYIDPPYNTGSRIRTDDDGGGYEDGLDHAAWLAMMSPRLALMKELLSEDGTLIVQIDDNEFARLYLLMESLFGEGNLKTVCVKMAEPTGVKMTHAIRHGHIPKLKEYLIVARKSGIRDLHLERIPKVSWDHEYKYLVTGIGPDEIEILKAALLNPACAIGREKSDGVGKQTGRSEAGAGILSSRDEETDIVPNLLEQAQAIGARLRLESMEVLYAACNARTAEEKLQAKYANAWRIVRDVATSASAKAVADATRGEASGDFFIITTPRGRRYLMRRHYNAVASQPRIRLLFADDYLTTHPGDFWADIKTTGLDNEGGVDFRKGKKPEMLLRRIIGMCTRPGDIVLDAFAGSGTTGAAALKMDRKFILIESADHCQTHLLPRLCAVVDGSDRQGISAIENWQGGSGFRYFKLCPK